MLEIIIFFVGCNLSSILFIIFMVGLSHRLDKQSVGIKLGKKLLSHLFFADDICLCATSKEDLELLKRQLELWCQETGMRVSSDKTQIITPNSTEVWTVTNMSDNESFFVEAVNCYKYLGIKQYKSLLQTSNERATLAQKKLSGYRKMVNIKKFFVSESVGSYLTIWKNVLLPGVLYGMEVMAWTPLQIENLEIEQNKFAKVLLSVPPSTANVVTEALLGLKSIQQLVMEARIRMLNRARSAAAGELLKAAWKFQVEHPENAYWKRLGKFFQDSGFSKSTEDLTLEDVDQKYRSKARTALIELKTMQWVRIPRVWWRKRIFVMDTEWSRTYVQFLTQNAGLGNRTDKLANFSLSQQNGRVIICPLCIAGENNETHLILECNEMKRHRSQYKITSSQNLQQWLDTRGSTDKQQVLREFFGDRHQPISFYVNRGLCLLGLRRDFFRDWTEKCGQTVTCSLDS